MTMAHDSSVDADIVCSRAKNHYDPYARIPEASSNVSDKENKDIEYHKAAFKPLHKNIEGLMYFSVSCSHTLTILLGTEVASTVNPPRSLQSTIPYIRLVLFIGRLYYVSICHYRITVCLWLTDKGLPRQMMRR